MRSHHRLILISAVSGLLIGCNRAPEKVAVAPKPTPLPRISDADLTKFKPNETGAIMVLMYHRIVSDEKNADLNRTPEAFRRDLENLRAKGYHPVTALEFVENSMQVPVGKTPVVLTFDDALESQFKVIAGSNGKPRIAPDCAIGIMETFHKKYPDWPTKATFFVLPEEGPNGPPFGQGESVSDKFAYLTKNGYEIANHSSTHSNFRRMDAGAIQKELATANKEIKAIAPKAAMQTLALPYGKLPRNEDARKFLAAGSSGGGKYSHKAVFLAAWRPVLASVTKPDKKLSNAGQFCLFEPYRLERVKPDAAQASSPGTFEYWLQYFDKNRAMRYISDGNAQVVSVPAQYKDAVDAGKVRAQNKYLQVYGGVSGGGKSGDGGSSLSVE